MSPGPTSRRLLPRPIGPAATGGVQILGISCCAGSCQSVTTCLCTGLASRLAVWQVFGLCVCAYEEWLHIHDWDSWFHKDDFWFSFQLGLGESLEQQDVHFQHTHLRWVGVNYRHNVWTKCWFDLIMRINVKVSQMIAIKSLVEWSFQKTKIKTTKKKTKHDQHISRLPSMHWSTV